MKSRFVAVLLLVLTTVGPSSAQNVPRPDQHFGFAIGTSKKLANWTQLTAYYERVAEASPRVRVDTLGPTTMGRPFVMLTVTSEDNHANLEALHEIQMKLADPRRVAAPEDLEGLLDTGKTVVLITHAIHSTEVGGAQTAARLIHRLASSDEPRIREILDNVILLDIPSLNPDGTEWVADWYMEHVGTEFEGAPLPWLYQYYVGHDNNRDWYAFTQDETRHAVLGAHNVWHPQIVHDIHQMGSTGARIFFPPYIDPIEHNVDPGLITAVNMLGTYMAAELTAQGKAGVVVDAIYDGFTPARAYQHYHGGARILSETASARLASPLTLSAEDVRGGRGYDAAKASVNFPNPWEGGEWGLPEIVDYMESGALALLTNAAKNRRYWLENFYRINERAIVGWDEWPEAWVIPAEGQNPSGLAYLLRILRTGDVEVFRASEPFEADSTAYPAGSYIVPMHQPYAAFAQTLLEVQHYPDLREYPGGPPRPPYDVTAHTLPLLMDVEAVPVESISAGSDAPVGAVLEIPEWDFRLPEALTGEGTGRIGVYKSPQEPMPAGWTRWVFDQHGLAYDTVGNARIQQGDLLADYEVLLFQTQSPESLLDGFAEGAVPAAFVGGLGVDGSAALAAFVRNGGRIVAIEAATDFIIDLLELRITNSVERLPTGEFFIPGSILNVDLDPEHPISLGMGEATPSWFWRSSRAFDVGEPGARVIGSFGTENPLLSGWILGPEHVAEKPALVEVPVGRGSVVLFGFQPNYRAQSVSTWPLLFNALAVPAADRPISPEGGGT